MKIMMQWMLAWTARSSAVTNPIWLSPTVLRFGNLK